MTFNLDSAPSKPFIEVIAMGNAIVDILSEVDEQFLRDHKLQKSTMMLCSLEQQNQLLSEVTHTTSEAGGSTANTAYCLAGLGAKTGFVGTISDDSWGKVFQESFKQNGVVSFLEVVPSDQATATSLILITPDSERTMNTHLGCAGYINKSALDQDALMQTKLIYIEGYLLDNDQAKDAVIQAIDIVREAGNKVALTLSDVECVRRHKADFIDLVKDADIVFGNEAEMAELFDCDISELTGEFLAQSDRRAAVTVATKSERGCVIVEDDEIIVLPAIVPDHLVDLTGAGDQFAAGFIFGTLREWPSEKSGQLAIELATKTISHLGPRISKQDLNDICAKFSTVDPSHI